MTNLLTPLSYYLGIVLLMILTGLGLPIPEELIVISTGAASSLQKLNPWPGLASCLIGALAGDSVVYWIGRHFGRRLLREHPWWARFLHAERERQIEKMIRRHGLKVFFLARFLVGLRAPIYLTAGILKVPFRRFLLVDTFSAAVVIGLFYGLSHRYGDQVGSWIRQGQYTLTAVALIAAAVATAWFFLWRRRQRVAQTLSESEAALARKGSRAIPEAEKTASHAP